MTLPESKLASMCVSNLAKSHTCARSIHFKNTTGQLSMHQHLKPVVTSQYVRQMGPGSLPAMLTLAATLALPWTLLRLTLTLTHTPADAQTPAQVREWRTPVPGNIQRGFALYQERCTACHDVDGNKIGPAHRGVLGRRVDSLPGYKYSEELARSRLRWTPQTLNAWLQDPEELVAGQRMGFQVEDPQDRADLIAYLVTLR